jgi:hypothetical protein
VEVKIGVQNVAREIVLESSQTAQEVTKAVAAALKGDGALELTDDKGRVIVVPTAALAYIEIGSEESRRVGFGGA